MNSSNPDIPEGISVVTLIPKGGRRKKGEQIDWLAIKEDYLLNPSTTLVTIAQKYGIAESTINQKSKRDGWAKERQIVYKRADEKALVKIEDRLAELKVRHALIGKFLQKAGIEAIKKKKVTIRSAKTALEYAVAGVSIERQAEGLDRQAPQIVNILAQQQGVIDKYSR
jgi:hypothetical protein